MKKQKLLLATTSLGKLKEIKVILKDLPLKVLSLFDVRLPKDFVVEEDGETLRENATKKAKIYGKQTGYLTLAEDAGLFVDALGGKPGVFSARYASGGDENRWRKLLGELEHLSEGKRTAKFICAIAIYDPRSKRVFLEEDCCRGKIALKPKGKHGFGYDSVFIVDKMNKYFGELTTQEKNRVSHRGKALRKIKKVLQRIINDENKS